jgi:hypothetical protein
MNHGTFAPAPRVVPSKISTKETESSRGSKSLSDNRASLAARLLRTSLSTLHISIEAEAATANEENVNNEDLADIDE